MTQKGKTILELMREQEPLNDYFREDICQLYCNDGPMPCGEPCSWLELFTKRRFIEVPLDENNSTTEAKSNDA